MEFRDYRFELIQTGIALFGHYGFEKTSINQISGTCGIAKGSFYNFFTSKESFFLQEYTSSLSGDMDNFRMIYSTIIRRGLFHDQG
ncbi:MAG: hypothetical protein B6241_03025 [Spirochaetaceae bacterium 4572_59]|nr:MAG: hypothetical protein B6241_03025 [Spirochaetaceae bacterium 4572_59]